MNPFPDDPDRQALWEMLVARDIDAFVRQDWGLVAGDFVDEGFTGLDARFRSNPDSWQLTFPTLGSYKAAWLEQAKAHTGRISAAALSRALFDATTLRDIDLRGESAVAHKKFDGALRFDDGEVSPLRWQTLYFCRKVAGVWKMSGFVGYLPNPLGDAATASDPINTALINTALSTAPAKQVPPGATQHATAGPYSPVLRVQADELVVISGQVAVAPDGSLIGQTLEDQAEATLHNCRRQLQRAGLDFGDVFKVNVYLTDLADWGAFNAVYRTLMPDPKPVRTAVGTRLLPGLLVEVEMWAAR